MKNDIWDIDVSIFRTVGDNECNAVMYENNYNKSMDMVMKKVAVKHHTNAEYLVITFLDNPPNSMLINIHNLIIYLDVIVANKIFKRSTP